MWSYEPPTVTIRFSPPRRSFARSPARRERVAEVGSVSISLPESSPPEAFSAVLAVSWAPIVRVGSSGF